MIIRAFQHNINLSQASTEVMYIKISSGSMWVPRYQESSMFDKSADRIKGQSIIFLHLYALCSFAFAQPIYDLLARYPEFLVTHQAELLDVILLILFLKLQLLWLLLL